MGIKSLKIRKEILEVGYQPAPKLGEILEFLDGKKETGGIEIMADPEKFLDRTVITESMVQILMAILDAFEGKRRRVLVLKSFFGGGKTHTLLAILHIFSNPELLNKVKDVSPNLKLKLEDISKRIKNLGTRVICFAGDYSVYSGSPPKPTNANGYTYRTVWGYIAHKLGKYSLVREFDESLTAPQEDLIKRLLEGEKILFLFDEIAEYVTILSGGQYREYAKSVVNFIEYFCKAVSSSNCVAVITLPFEVKYKSEDVDWRFEDSKIIESIRNSLDKESDSFETIRNEDVVDILKKRLFEEIDEYLREIAVERFREIIVNYPQYFPNNYNYEDQLKRCYPFSPEYVEVLERLVNETRLQKTRAALEISISVLKRIYEEDEDPLVIKPWHIDILKISGAFDGRNEYSQIFVKQVLVDNPLHTMILKCIFYYTYYYDTGRLRKEYPDIKNIVRAVYEPETFIKMGKSITDIENGIVEVKNRDDVMNLYFFDNKLWFWKLPTINDYIERTSKKILSSGDPRMWDVIKKSIEESYSHKSSKETPRQSIHGFDKLEITENYGYPKDEEKLRLVVILKPEIAAGDFPKKIIMETEEKKSRINKNTLVVVLPREPFTENYVWNNYKEYRELCECAAKLVAIEDCREKLAEWYEDQNIIKIQEEILKNTKKNKVELLRDLIPRVYCWIVYPAKSDVECEKITELSRNLAVGVWKTLQKKDKVAEKLDISYLIKIIRDLFGVDVERDDRAWELETIKSWFKQYTSLPFVSDEAIESAIKDGVRSLKLGIRSESGVYFKRVHDHTPIAKDTTGDVPTLLDNKNIVMTRKRAIREQIEFLKSRETRRDILTHIEETRYILKLGDRSYTLSELMSLPDWERLFLEGVIIRERKKIPKDEPRLEVRVHPSETLEVGVNETVNFTISAKPYNFDPDEVRIKITSKNKVLLDEPMNKIDGGFVKDFEITPEREEYYSVEISAKPPNVEPQKKSLIVKIKAEKKKRVNEEREIGDKYEGCKLLEITDILDFETVKILREILVRERALEFAAARGEGKPRALIDAEIEGKESGGTLELRIKRMPAEAATNAAVELTEYCSERTIHRFELRFENVVLDRRLIERLKRLNDRVKFTIELEEK